MPFEYSMAEALLFIVMAILGAMFLVVVAGIIFHCLFRSYYEEKQRFIRNMLANDASERKDNIYE